jgi:Flp pilus assembly protein TadD
LGILQAVVEKRPLHFEALQEVSRLLALEGRFEEALIHAAKAVEARPDDLQAREAQGRLRRRVGRDSARKIKQE